jgi:hypothetical protein
LRVKIERRDAEEIARFVREADLPTSSGSIRVIVQDALRRHPEQSWIDLSL